MVSCFRQIACRASWRGINLDIFPQTSFSTARDVIKHHWQSAVIDLRLLRIQSLP